MTYLIYFGYNHVNQDLDFNQHIDLDELVMCQLISYFLYFIILESIFKTTVGIRIFKLMVIYQKNDKQIWWRNTIRAFMRMLPFTFIPFILNSDRVFWHEQLSKTRTISIK